RRRSGWLRRALAAAAVVAVGLLIAAVWLRIAAHRGEEQTQVQVAVVDAARAAAVTLLTADPAHPDAYVAKALAVTTGEQRTRLVAASAALRSAVAEQRAPSTGRILGAGLLTDPGHGASAQVLLVVAASNPELVGGDPDTDRITVSFTMIRVDGAWRVGATVPV
ncbi:MAG: hypothetical protein QM662_19595, partial [Gordonia sp. (in: high G+C Gram-positive bacteria)]